jgi:hypothetical protein
MIEEKSEIEMRVSGSSGMAMSLQHYLVIFTAKFILGIL